MRHWFATAGLVAALMGGPPAHAATTGPELPLEVLGPAGTEVAVTVTLEPAQLARGEGAAIELTLHNIVRAGSAVLVVNGGPAIGLDAPFVHADGQATSARLPLPRGALVAGPNRLVFRYARQVTEGGSAVSGFRVLALALHLGGRRVPIGHEGPPPGQWRPIRGDAASIARGQAFFQTVSRDGGPACARCHAQSGADLKYHAFSDKSLVERALRHQFTPSEAQDLASYIRALDVPSPGRPHQSPFQPGPGNRGAAGAGPSAVLADDSAFAQAVFAHAPPGALLPWDWPATIDPFTTPTAVRTPSWLRWLPRSLDPAWFSMQGGALAQAEQDLARTPTLANANAFMATAKSVGLQLLLTTGDHPARIDVLRFAAVKLWDWARLHSPDGFDGPDHGLPDQAPPFPYEVGFAFFEAAQAGKHAVPEAMAQTLSWWWAQFAAHPGRGLSTGTRPLNYLDVLTAAEASGLGPAQMRFLHLYGRWEESRGPLAPPWGSAEGPIRLLPVALRHATSPLEREAIFRGFLDKEAEVLAQKGATLNQAHLLALGQAWNAVCGEWSAEQKTALWRRAPGQARSALHDCP